MDSMINAFNYKKLTKINATNPNSFYVVITKEKLNDYYIVKGAVNGLDFLLHFTDTMEANYNKRIVCFKFNQSTAHFLININTTARSNFTRLWYNSRIFSNQSNSSKIDFDDSYGHDGESCNTIAYIDVYM